MAAERLYLPDMTGTKYIISTKNTKILFSGQAAADTVSVLYHEAEEKRFPVLS